MTRKRTAFTDVFLMPFGLIFVLAGLATGVFLYGWQLRDWFRARDWVEVPCVIESASLREETRRSRKSNSTRQMHEAEATYSYDFDGRRYTGSRVSLSSGADNMGDYQSRTAALLARHTESKQPFRCYVNPANPEESLLFRQSRWPLLLLMSLFPALFPSVGGAVFFTGWLAFRRRRQQQRLEARFPGQPWRSTPAWEEEWMRARNEHTLLPWLVITGWLSAVWLPLLYVVTVDGEVSWGRPLSWLAWLPALPLLFLFRSCWRRLRQKWTGWPRLHAEPRPFHPGETVRASLALPPHFPAGMHGQVTVTLRCVKQTLRRSGKNVSTHRETRWSEEQVLPLMQATSEPGGRRLALDLPLPADQPAAAAEDSGRHFPMPYVWELEVRHPKLAVPPVFELPVFQKEGQAAEHAGASPEGMPVRSLRAEREAAKNAPPMAAADVLASLEKAGIRAELDSRGLPVRLEMGAERFRGGRTFLTVFTLLWSGVVVIILCSGAPLLFGLFFGAIALVLWWQLFLLARHLTLRMNAEGLAASWRLGPLGGQVRYEKRHLVRFFSQINVKSGGTSYHQVCAETTFGKQAGLADGLNGVQAETVCGLLERWRKEA